MNRSRVWGASALVILSVVLSQYACGGAGKSVKSSRAPSKRAEPLELSGPVVADPLGNRCDGRGPNRDVSEYDTSGDSTPDVRKVFMTKGVGGTLRLILICRESDLNGDNVKDIIRFYDDEGRPMRDEADRNFDGKIDEVTYFEAGLLTRQEIDSNGNGRVDTKIFYEHNKPVRTERDMSKRSDKDHWRPDTWEYFEDGQIVRTGTDVNGDGNVDRWDRDVRYRVAPPAPGSMDNQTDKPNAAADAGAAPPQAAQDSKKKKS